MDSHTLSYIHELMQIAVHGGTSRNAVEKFMLTLHGPATSMTQGQQIVPPLYFLQKDDICRHPTQCLL